jgi:hypothetical protein
MNVYLRKSTNERKSQKISLMQLSEEPLEIVSVFQESSRNLIFIFLFNKAGKKLKTICTCTESTDLTFR